MNAYDEDQVEITVNSNPPPIADAGIDQIVPDGDGNGMELVTLDGSNSYDTGIFIESYEWRNGAVVLGTLPTPTLQKTFYVGEHTITLKVTDFGGATATDTVITVSYTHLTLPTN